MLGRKGGSVINQPVVFNQILFYFFKNHFLICHQIYDFLHYH